MILCRVVVVKTVNVYSVVMLYVLTHRVDVLVWAGLGLLLLLRHGAHGAACLLLGLARQTLARLLAERFVDAGSVADARKVERDAREDALPEHVDVVGLEVSDLEEEALVELFRNSGQEADDERLHVTRLDEALRDGQQQCSTSTTNATMTVVRVCGQFTTKLATTHNAWDHDGHARLGLHCHSRVHSQSTVFESNPSCVHQCDFCFGNLVIHLKHKAKLLPYSFC